MNYERLSACESQNWMISLHVFCFGGQKDEKSGLKPKKSQDVGAAGFRLKSAQSVSRAIVKRQAVWQVFLRLLHGMWTSLVPSMYQSCCPCCPSAFATANMVEHLRLSGRGQVPSPVVKVKASTFHWENLCRRSYQMSMMSFAWIYLRSYDFFMHYAGVCFFHTP